MKFCFVACFILLASACALFARDITTLTGETYHEATFTRIETTGIAIAHRDGTAFLNFSVLPADIRAEFSIAGADPDAVQPGPELVHSPEIVTLDGTVYRDVTVTRIERTGVHISSRTGIEFLDFLNLPVPFRRKYGYTDAAYAAGKMARLRREQAETQRRLAEAQAALAQQQAAAAARDYSQRGYPTRDYSTDRYTGSNSSGGTVQVSGYFRKDGTYVHSYTRRK